ncbi:MAG: hypothetical protein ACR2KW_02735 [Rubrobacter sp.]
MGDFFEKITEKVGVRGLLASAALLLGLVLGDALLHEEAYAEIGYAFALFSIIGSAACLGYLLFITFKSRGGLFGPNFAQARYRTDLRRKPPTEAGSWPVLISLLYSPLCVLFAGLAGWVDNPVR